MALLAWTLALVCMPGAGQAAEVLPKTRVQRYQVEVENMAALPVPAAPGVVLVGSSIFKRWTNADLDLAPLVVSNRAFGGSRTGDQLEFFEKIVPKSNAAVLVWYCGSNDVNGKILPAEIVQNTQTWLLRARAALPDAQVVLVSVIRAPQKRKAGLLSQVEEVNQGLRRLAATSLQWHYLDINAALETPDGDSVAAYYLPDQLHLTPAGYAQLTRVLGPAVISLLQAPRSH